MYIIKAKTRTIKNKEYHSFRLVESARTPTNKVRQHVLLNLGSNYSTIKESEWKSLTDRIESMLGGVIPLLPFPAHIEQEAQRITNILIKRRGTEITSTQDGKHIETVDISTLDNSDVKSVGAENLVYETAEKLQLTEVLKGCGFSQKQTDLAFGTILGRLLSPGSELATCSYLREKSALDEVIGVDFSGLHKNQLYEISDVLLKTKKKLKGNYSKMKKHYCNLRK